MLIAKPYLLVSCLVVISALIICGCKEQGQDVAEPQAAETNPSSSSVSDEQENTSASEGNLATPASAKKFLQDTKGETDNQACYVCHADFAFELIATKHEEVGVICISCHGYSFDHRSDEYNIVKPDILFGRAQIVEFCKHCHLTHKTGETYDAFLAKWAGKRRPNGRPVMKTSVCTDCHGNHAILRPEHDFSEPETK